jgi:hypothetical protein
VLVVRWLDWPLAKRDPTNARDCVTVSVARNTTSHTFVDYVGLGTLATAVYLARTW